VFDPGDIAPQSEHWLTVETEYAFQPDCEYHIEFAVALNAATFYADGGYEIGRFQYPLRGAVSVPKWIQSLPADVPAPPQSTNDETFTTLTLGALSVRINKADGVFSVNKNGTEYLQLGGTPTIARPWSGLDAFPGWGPQVIFEAMHPQNTKTAFDGNKTNGATLLLHYTLTTPLDGKEFISHARHRLTLHDGGFLEVETEYDLNPNLMYVPRAGMELIFTCWVRSAYVLRTW